MCTSGFADWYHDSDQSTTYPTELVLYNDGEGNYVNRHGDNGEPWVTTVGVYQGTDCTVPPHCGPFYGTPFFFPVDDIPEARGNATSIAEVATTEYGLDGGLHSEAELTGAGPLHNFSFTSEVEYWIPYDADTNATLRFTGDDDIWVFINGQLALDLGGLHPALAGEVTVSGTSAAFVGGTGAAHLMTPGNVYPIKVFHAERHTTGSTFRLTLSGFVPSRSSCDGECGNGTVEYGEECDDGDLNRDEYNRCGTMCKLTEYCGDGEVTHDEACDDATDSTCHGCRRLEVK
jgi:fibro-slime domain-containing protein